MNRFTRSPLGAAFASAALADSLSVAYAADKIKIAFIYPLSGPFESGD